MQLLVVHPRVNPARPPNHLKVDQCRFALTPNPRRAALAAPALFAVLGALLWAPAAPGPAQAAGVAEPSTRSTTVAALGATYTDRRHARTNYATRSVLRISKTRFNGYLAFPAVALEPGETITGARLVLTVTKVNKAGA